MQQNTSGGEGILKDKQLFIGLASVSNYSNDNISISEFEEDVINTTFERFKDTLEDTLDDFDASSSALYSPVNFYAFGFFNLITLSLIDDYHFGNFSYRPYNRHLDFSDKSRSKAEKSNFQFQVMNGYNLITKDSSCSIDFKKKIAKRNFIAVCKLKINSSLLIGMGRSTIDHVVSIVKDKCSRLNDFIISESFSWHELTIIALDDSIAKIVTVINEIRKDSIDSTSLKGSHFKNCLAVELIENQESGNLNLFTDTESIYALNPHFFSDDGSKLKAYKCSLNDEDKALKVSTKIQIKTGHADYLNDAVRNSEFEDLFNLPMRIVNGRSDYSINYKKDAIVSFISAWRKLTVEPDTLKLGEKIFENVRKLHSNISLDYPSKKYESKEVPNTSLHKNLFNTIKFKYDEIRAIEDNLASLKVSKEIANAVLTAFTNFNDIICDINLYSFYVDLKTILDSLEYNIASLKKQLDTGKRGVAYNSVHEVSEMLLSYVNNFQNAYRNRFLDSKKNGYNLDIKGEFNGGVHQIIHAYDSCYKIIVQSLRKIMDHENESKHFLPIASYGGNTSGIKASARNLHLNYFQLFQPEFFLFSSVKEAGNYIFNEFDIKNNKNDALINLDELISECSTKLSSFIFEEPALELKKLYYKYLPPDKLKNKIEYIFQYYLFFKVVWEEDMECLTFWLWNIYTQFSNLYNLDGSLRIDNFREHFLAFYIAAESLMKYEDDFDDYLRDVLVKNVQAPDILYYLFEEDVLKDCSEIFNTLFLNDNNVHIVEKIIKYMSNIDSKVENFNVKNKDKAFAQILTIMRHELREVMDAFITEEMHSDGTKSMMTYLRKPDNGKGVDKNQLAGYHYSRAVFDPHGGIFCRDPQLRQDIMLKRLSIIDKLRNISYQYKKEFYS